jgi:hypothetical protein
MGSRYILKSYREMADKALNILRLDIRLQCLYLIDLSFQKVLNFILTDDQRFLLA